MQQKFANALHIVWFGFFLYLYNVKGRIYFNYDTLSVALTSLEVILVSAGVFGFTYFRYVAEQQSAKVAREVAGKTAEEIVKSQVGDLVEKQVESLIEPALRRILPEAMDLNEKLGVSTGKKPEDDNDEGDLQRALDSLDGDQNEK